MTRSTKTQLLYSLLGLFILASMTYYVMSALSFYQRVVHAHTFAHRPFTLADDGLTIDNLSAEAKAAGLQKGDVLVSFEGHPYKGESQWIERLGGGHNALRPGDTLPVTVRRSDVLRAASIRLTPGHLLQGTILVAAIVIDTLPPLVCLLVGYWVAWARPHDWNAWLLMLVLSSLEALGPSPDWWPGAWIWFLGTWYMTLQIFGPLSIFLFGIYFPERWRLDVKLPLLKWLLILPVLVAFIGIMWIQIVQTFYIASQGPLLKTLEIWFTNLLNPINLLCVLVYWVAIIDKLRSATTADARRRMRVVCAGSVIGLGSLLIVFVLLPHFVSEGPTMQVVRILGAVLILAFPLSLAYVVVVQRALDIRIIVRMGTRYALARATLVALELAFVALIVVRVLFPLYQKREDLAIAIPLTIIAVAGLIKIFASRNSLSNRMQQWLDRKFFREAYDAEIVLSELSEQARGFTETGPLIETISRRISEVLHVPQVCVFLRSSGLRGGQVFQLQPQSVGVPQLSAIKFHESSSTIRNLARSNRPATLYREDPDGWFLLADERERQALEHLHAELLLPLAGRDRLLGVMTLGAKRSQEAYSPTDLRLLQSVSTQTGLALEISELIHSLARQAAERERIDREIEIAREVQERLFPQEVPLIDGVSLAGGCRPAQGVGGDYYDFIELEGGQLGVAIGDISGKGISAALLMASLRASLRGVTMDGSKNLAIVMKKVNRLVYEASANNRYATFFFAIFDPATLMMRYVNAGHNSPIIVRGDASFTLDGGGPVIGLLQHASYEEQHVQLQGGDLFIGYTDGISEAMTHQEEEWGEERMIAAATCVKQTDAAAILKCIFDEADVFTAGAPQHDDMTLLLMKLRDRASS